MYGERGDARTRMQAQRTRRTRIVSTSPVDGERRLYEPPQLLVIEYDILLRDELLQKLLLDHWGFQARDVVMHVPLRSVRSTPNVDGHADGRDGVTVDDTHLRTTGQSSAALWILLTTV